MYTDITVRVYNRWGSLVYDNPNYQTGDNWTGNGKNSKPIPVGSYYYVVEYKVDGIPYNETGPITIIR